MPSACRGAFFLATELCHDWRAFRVLFRHDSSRITLDQGLAHFPGSVAAAPRMGLIVIASVGYGILAYLTGSILPGMVLHAAQDILGSTLLWLSTRGSSVSAPPSSPWASDPMFLVKCVATLVLGGGTVWAFRQLATAAKGESLPIRSATGSSTARTGSNSRAARCAKSEPRRGVTARQRRDDRRFAPIGGPWILPDPWKTQPRVSHRSLDDAHDASPTGSTGPAASPRGTKTGYNPLEFNPGGIGQAKEPSLRSDD